MRELWLEMLGCTILVRCAYETCRDGIRAYYRPMVTDDPWRTPDVVVECDWETAGKFLFRARPADDMGYLPGVRVGVLGRDPQGWDRLSPPLPPFDVAPFCDRFVGLHAAAVLHGGKAVLAVGVRGAGKSSFAVEAVNNHSASLLTDETVLLIRRTTTVVPFPRSIGITTDPARGTKTMLPADEVCLRVSHSAAVVGGILHLLRMPGVRPTLRPLRPEENLRLLLASHLDVGCSMGEGVATLTAMARQVPGSLFTYGARSDLLAAVPDLTAGIAKVDALCAS